ncbi:MAG: glycosyltransferase family 2 protein [Ignavibacteria bacterium]
MKEPISIIILNFNGKQFLSGCLSSVLAQSYDNFEIVFFDNNSTDGSIEFVKSEFEDPRINIVKSESNLGFAGGNNEALKRCNNDLIVLLNNDTIVNELWLEELAVTMDTPGTIASSFVKTNGIPEKYYKSNGSISYLMYNIMNIFPKIEDEFYPNGCSVIFRKSEIIEPFDSDYFFYGEDVYLGLKARFMGMRVIFVKTSVVEHFGGGSSTGNEFKTICAERNRFLNLYSFFSLWFIIRLMPYIIFNQAAKLLISFLSKKYSTIGLLKAYIWFYFNIPLILKKRKELTKIKKVNQKEIIKYISSKILNDGTITAKILNNISYFYSRLTGIKPIEYFLRNKLPL